MSEQPIPREIEAVFAKLLLVYGSGKLNATYRDQDIGTVKRHWAHELRGVTPAGIAYGLTQLPREFVPNVLQFRDACMRAPLEQPKQLPAPVPSPEQRKRTVAAMRALAEAMQPKAGRDPKAWARAILRQVERGGYVPIAHRDMAEAALWRELHPAEPEGVE